MSEKKKKKATNNSKNGKKINWEKAEKEYISTQIGYRALAKKYKISERQVMRYGSEHEWVEKRRQFVSKVSANVENALIQNETDNQLDKLKAIGDAADILRDEIFMAITDGKQLYTRSFYDCDNKKVVEYESSKLDGGQLNQLVRALDKLKDIIRDVNNIAKEEPNKKVEFEFVLPEGMKDFGN